MRTKLTLAALALTLACSSSDSDKTAAFVGTWAVTGGMVTAMCPAPLGTVTQKFDSGSQEIVKGTDSDIVFTLLPNCQLKLDVSGSTATLKTMPVQTCNLSFNGIPVQGTFTSGTVMLTGTMAKYDYAGTAAIGGGASAIMCPVVGTGTSVKGAPAAEGGAPAADAGSSADSGGSTD
jgi:hypothetical protein